uniref:HTH La-type RNA-binding domain-containing protein n=1 Tax=Romanomermis culicivorax TaxID=13658 RepID=A0A915KLX5_ROMCU
MDKSLTETFCRVLPPKIVEKNLAYEAHDAHNLKSLKLINNTAPPQNNDQPAETVVNSYYVNPRMVNEATGAYKESVTPVVGVQKISLGTPVDAAYVVRQIAENAQPLTPNDIETRVENGNHVKSPCENVITNLDVDPASALSSADIEMESLRYKLQKQLEYYFSRENLTTDAYLKSQMDGDQYVAIKTIANFNKIKKMTSDLDLVISVLRESLVVQVDEKGEKVRAVSKRRTLVLRDIPDETSEA